MTATLEALPATAPLRFVGAEELGFVATRNVADVVDFDIDQVERIKSVATRLVEQKVAARIAEQQAAPVEQVANQAATAVGTGAGPGYMWVTTGTGGTTAYIEAINMTFEGCGGTITTTAKVRYNTYAYSDWSMTTSPNFIRVGNHDTGWTTIGNATSSNSVLWADTAVTTVYGSSGYAHNTWVYPKPKTPAERLLEILKSRQAPMLIGSARKALDPLPSDIRELRARDTLKRVLGEIKFKDFLRKGFVSVRAKSSLIYQIFPGHGITAVFDQGTMVERLCVVMKGDFPPTDSIIMRYLLILNNEDEFRSLAVKHNVSFNKRGQHYPNFVLPKNPDQRQLTEIFREMKHGKRAA